MSLLAGIKKGKKKRKEPSATGDLADGDVNRGRISVAKELGLPVVGDEAPPTERRVVSEPQLAKGTSVNSNQSMADQLRAQLAGRSKNTFTLPSSSSSSTRAHGSSDLEKRGRIGAAIRNQQTDSSMAPTVTVAAASSAFTNDDAANQSISDMLKDEKSQSMSLEELEARNLLRVGKKRTLKARNGAADSDEEDDVLVQQQHTFLMDANSAKAARRETSRAVAKSDLQDKMVSKLWWWIESNQFERRRLMALGNYVSLVMAPLQLSLIRGQHFYLVPVAHVESMAAAEDEVWDEIVRFQTSLRALFDQQNHGLVIFETVTPGNSFWQTRLECVAIPKAQWMDAPLFIKQALLEQAQDEGTHQKVMAVTPTKDLRASVPKNFSYVYMEYDQQQGYVQMIESRDFPKDFAVDTIAGMIQEDPVRFRRKEKVVPEKERSIMLSFLDKWKAFDWTLQLDS